MKQMGCWVNAAKYPMLTEPEPAYHGVVYTDALAEAAAQEPAATAVTASRFARTARAG